MTDTCADDNWSGKDLSKSAPANTIVPSLEIELLSELRAALADQEVSSELYNDFACLTVTSADPSFCIRVFVGFGRRYFSWNNAQYQHPVRDMPGAANRIASQVQGHINGRGDR